MAIDAGSVATSPRISICSLKFRLMSLIDWNNPEERLNYFRKKSAEYRKTHPRVTLTFTEEEFEWLDRSAKHYGISSKLSRHVKGLAIEAAKIGLGEQVERPPQVPQETVDEMLYQLYNASNNINQIAYNLNSRAKEAGISPVAGETESRKILHELFRMLRELEDELRPLISEAQK